MDTVLPDRRRLLLGGLALPWLSACGGGGSASAAPSPPPAPAADVPALKTHFAARFKIGMAADPAAYKNATANPVLLKHANSITAENACAIALDTAGRQNNLQGGISAIDDVQDVTNRSARRRSD